MSKFSQATPRERKDYLVKRLQDLERLRAPWLDRWREVSDFIYPYGGRFEIHDKFETRNYDKIFDNEAGRSLDTLVSGLASGATSPVRQWFKVTVPDLDAQLDIGTAQWCSEVEHMLMRAFQQSNTYNSLHTLYRELCLFGVGVDLVMEDENDILRHHVLTAGEYCLQVNSDGIVDTLYRTFQLTVSQAVNIFGWDNVPKVIKDMYVVGDLDRYFDFCHAIEPRHDRDENSPSNKNMPWASYYFMLSGDAGNDAIISESGFKMFPALCPRWDVLAGDVYGMSPAIRALPNVKQLQQECECKSWALELLVNPPVQAPSTLRQEPLSLTPGAVSFTGITDTGQAIKPIITTSGDINAITQDIMQLKQDIKSDFYVDLFLLIQQATSDRMTATEVAALKEEKMLVLGPVIERLQHELLSPLVQMTYNKLKERKLLPEAPQSIKGRSLELEFQSMLAQSQRAVDINAIDRMMSSVQAMATVAPEILDRIDVDGTFDVYRDRLAVDPKIARSVDEANEIRQSRNQVMAQQQQSAEVEQGAAAYNQFMQAQKAGADASMATQQLSPVGGMM